jgi:tol-pal system protein YbgF
MLRKLPLYVSISSVAIAILFSAAVGAQEDQDEKIKALIRDASKECRTAKLLRRDNLKEAQQHFKQYVTILNEALKIKADLLDAPDPGTQRVLEFCNVVKNDLDRAKALPLFEQGLRECSEARVANDLQLGGPPTGSPSGSIPVPSVPSAAVSATATGSVSTAAAAAAAAPAADAEQERSDYMAAFEILREGRYAQAIEAFTVFIKKYPAGKYANNAQYWVGEAHYASRNLEQALVEFEKLIKDYPWSSKIPDAKLKMGYTLYELGQWQKSREVLINIMTTYPKSSFALLAEKRVQRLTQEGH